MIAVQRGASNLYFPDVASSILIPPFSTRVYRVLREPDVWGVLSDAERNGADVDPVCRTIAMLRHVDAEQLRAAFEVIRLGGAGADARDVDETSFRLAEYRALLGERRGRDDFLTCRPQRLEDYGAVVRDHFAAVTLVERLAETRALTGFQRLASGMTTPARLSRRRVNWLPAFRVFGEGVFLTLREERLRAISGKGQERWGHLRTRARLWPRTPVFASPEMLLLHTLAHLLIKRLSFEAGYGASAIRERIYAVPDGHPHRMAGILLYTAAGDADGTLGGLVGLGRPNSLERIVAGALDDARWCAADPICRESRGQGPESLNLSACHACALLPETSCEFQNRLLERGIVGALFER